MRRVFNRKDTDLVCKVASSQFDRQKSRRFGFEATFSRFHMVKILGWHFEVKIILGNLWWVFDPRKRPTFSNFPKVLLQLLKMCLSLSNIFFKNESATTQKVYFEVQFVLSTLWWVLGPCKRPIHLQFSQNRTISVCEWVGRLSLAMVE